MDENFSELTHREEMMQITYEEMLVAVQRFAETKDESALQRLKEQVDRSTNLNQDQRDMLNAKIKAATPPEL